MILLDNDDNNLDLHREFWKSGLGERGLLCFILVFGVLWHTESEFTVRAASQEACHQGELNMAYKQKLHSKDYKNTSQTYECIETAKITPARK